MKLKIFNQFASAIIVAALVSFVILPLFGLGGTKAFAVLMVLSIVTPLFFKMPKLAIFSGIYREAWDRELVRRFDDVDNGSWREGIRDLGKYFQMLNDGEVVVVNLTYWGVSPDVLINNTSYPITIQSLDGENVTVQVNKFQTKATPVTDDEIRGLNYDKMATVQSEHVIKITEEKNAMGIHSVGPAANTTETPVVLTTGALVGTRRRLTIQDVIDFRDKLNKLKHPREGRRLVLCNDHINDLLSLDEKFRDQYKNNQTGKIYNLFNFELFENNSNPYYHVGTKAKLAYGGTVTSNHFEASVYFHLRRVVQGKGFSKNYLSESKTDPLNQRNLFNIRHYDIVTPYKQAGVGAIVSGVE
jgi:hypothetical protein